MISIDIVDQDVRDDVLKALEALQEKEETKLSMSMITPKRMSQTSTSTEDLLIVYSRACLKLPGHRNTGLQYK